MPSADLQVKDLGQRLRERPESREIVAECAEMGESDRLARLLEEYVAPSETGADEPRRTTADAPTT